jgi:glycosyltransferase involved in cell wall biosynthesis
MMDKEPLVSVLMPCYNGEQYVTEAIHSILNQTYKNWELLICNDASTDDSLNVLESFKSDKIKVFENTENEGYLKTCNFLFQQAKGDYITFQDSDDYSSLDRIQLLINEFDQNPNLGACGTQFNFMTDSGIKLPDNSPIYPVTHNEIAKSFMGEPGFCGASVMVTKEVIKEIGVYNKYWDRIGSEDHYWLYLIAEKFEIANIKETSYFYRHNPNSVTRNKTNPRKIHCHDFLIYFFKQRQEIGTDDIERKDQKAISKMECSYTSPYTQDPTFIYKKLIDWAYTDKNYKAVFKHIFSALEVKPLSLYWYKTLFYYTRKIYL